MTVSIFTFWRLFQLSEKLSEAEKELESLKIKQDLCEAMMEAEVAAKGAGKEI